MTKNYRRSLLSQEQRVACEIDKQTARNKKVWAKKLVKLMKRQMSEAAVMTSLNTLIDFGVVVQSYEKIGEKTWARCFSISGTVRSIIRKTRAEFYERKRVRGDERG